MRNLDFPHRAALPEIAQTVKRMPPGVAFPLAFRHGID
jgi:hypothetical protein